MQQLVRGVFTHTFSRYVTASAVALGVDVACVAALVAMGTGKPVAAAAGYSLGIAAHWLLSSRAVFDGAVATDGPARLRQKALFVISAVIGLVLTTGIVSLATGLGMHLAPAKAIAVAVSFLATWLIRRSIVFRAVPLTA
ncbi:GtrA family protein [Novosphingobium colocasiae]|uniref:GtrA family protein n=1 Tax=Novosphingobium colocasiae TaxID=1256513 RepID=UPI0035B17404